MKNQKKFRKIRSLVGAAVVKHSMIQKDERILVGLSGGKDSYLLYDVLCELQKRSPISFEIEASVIDFGFGVDVEKICQWVLERGGLCTVYKASMEWMHENANPCVLCSRLRRAFLCRVAHERNCNVIALGHHRNDAIVTLFLNMMYAGKLFTMRPAYWIEKENIRLIRPLIGVQESLIREYVLEVEYPLMKQDCPLKQQDSKRAMIAEFVECEGQKNPWIYSSLENVQQKIMEAIQS